METSALVLCPAHQASTGKQTSARHSRVDTSASAHAPWHVFRIAPKTPLQSGSGLVRKGTVTFARVASADPEVFDPVKGEGPRPAASSCLCQGRAWSTPSDRGAPATLLG